MYCTDWTDPQLNTADAELGFLRSGQWRVGAHPGYRTRIVGAVERAFSYSLGYTFADGELTDDVYQPAGNIYGGPLFVDKVAADGDRLPGSAENVFNVSLAYDTVFAMALP